MATNPRRNAGLPKRSPAEKLIMSKKAAPILADSGKEESHQVFRDNLPCFQATIRGNVVADSETFTAKSGETYDTFRIAYTRMRNGDKSTMFIKVIGAHTPDFAVAKGNYVEVTGAYSDDGVTPGKDGYAPSVFRTIFMGADDTCKVLIG